MYAAQTDRGYIGVMLVLLLVDGVMLPLAEFAYLARTVHATATTLAFLRKKNLRV